MNSVSVLVVVLLACGRVTIHGLMSYSSPYVYGNGVPVRQNYRRLTTVPVRRTYYAPVHSQNFAVVQPRAYAPVHPVSYPAQARSYAPIHPAAYATRPRTYSPFHQSYASTQTRTYAPVQPRSGYTLTQPRTYQQVAAISRASVQRSPWYAARPKPRVAYYVPVTRPVSNIAATQPIRSVSVQRPVTRMLTPGMQWYHNHAASVPYAPQYVTARRLTQQPRLLTYGRNKIPRIPSPRGSVPRNPIKAQTQRITSSTANTKRNNIAQGTKFNSRQPNLQVTRNQINGLTMPNKFVVQERGRIQPIKPRIDFSTQAGKKLSTYLKNVKNLQDAFKGNAMKQDLIYYNDDVSNKTRHQPTNFAPPTRKLGSQGAPGGSRVTFRTENENPLGLSAKDSNGSNLGDKRVNIGQNSGKMPGERTVGDITPGNTAPGETIPGKTTSAGISAETSVEKPSEDLFKAVVVKSTINRGEKKSPKVVTDSPGNTAGLNSSFPTHAGSEKHVNFDNPKVDLGLLKDKVLHSNNSQFLQRVLQVLRKYTKLMKSSMAEKNGSLANSQKAVLNASSSGAQDQNTTSIKANSSEKIDGRSQKSPSKILLDNSTSTIVKSENYNTSSIENSMNLTDALRSKSTAIKIFDLLNSASKHNSETLLEKDDLQTKTNGQKNDTIAKQSSNESLTNNVSNTKSANSESKSQKHDTDENASKKERIETEHNLGKPIFNVEKLKNGLNRGNTIN